MKSDDYILEEESSSECDCISPAQGVHSPAEDYYIEVALKYVEYNNEGQEICNQHRVFLGVEYGLLDISLGFSKEPNQGNPVV